MLPVIHVFKALCKVDGSLGIYIYVAIDANWYKCKLFAMLIYKGLNKMVNILKVTFLIHYLQNVLNAIRISLSVVYKVAMTNDLVFVKVISWWPTAN